MSNQRLEIIRKEIPALEKILALNVRPGTDVATIAMQEIMYLEALTQTKPEILQCTEQSIVLAVRGVMKQNLTLDPYAGLVYTKTRSINIGTQDNKQWVKVLEMQPTANGLISINRQLGRILDYTNPQVKKDAQGKVIGVSMQILKPSYPNPRWETFEFDESDFKRWRIASHKENGRSKNDADIQKLNYANASYTNFNGGIDPEFARAKCIRHSLKKLGTNPQESNATKIYDVPKERIVDPNKDEYIETTYETPPDDDGFIQHEEVDTKINQTNINLPDSDDL
jgi:hypothetical protein